MSATPTKTSSQPLVWDYAVSAAQARPTVLGENNGSAYKSAIFNQTWALSRLLQHHSFYEVIETVPFEVLQKNWKSVKPTLMSKSLQEAYEYYINKVISTTR